MNKTTIFDRLQAHITAATNFAKRQEVMNEYAKKTGIPPRPAPLPNRHTRRARAKLERLARKHITTAPSGDTIDETRAKEST